MHPIIVMCKTSNQQQQQQQQRRQRYWPIQWFNALDGRLHPINSLPPVVPKLCIILLGQTRTFHILVNIIPPCLPWASPPSHSLYLHLCTTFNSPVSLSRSTCSKHLSANHKAECIQSQLLSELCISPFIHSEQTHMLVSWSLTSLFSTNMAISETKQTHMSIWSCSVHDNQQQEINNYACRNTKPLF